MLEARFTVSRSWAKFEVSCQLCAGIICAVICHLLSASYYSVGQVTHAAPHPPLSFITRGIAFFFFHSLTENFSFPSRPNYKCARKNSRPTIRYDRPRILWVRYGFTFLLPAKSSMSTILHVEIKNESKQNRRACIYFYFQYFTNQDLTRIKKTLKI